jgi:Ca2+-binding EF-hand superfamily protein
MIPMECMQAAMKLFREHATVPSGGVVFVEGELTKANLAAVMRQMAGTANDVIEACLVESAFTIADQDNNGGISFYEFAIWYSSHSFDEHFNLDARELELRKLARQIDMSPSEFDTYKRHFDSFDTDGNGTMDREEFYDMMLKCLKVPKHIGLPAGRVQQLWTAADSDGSGVIDFAEFVVFFQRYFPQWGASCPQSYSQYYSQNNGPLNALYDF